MKKLLAVSVISALLIQAAFGEISVSGTVGAGATLLRGSNVNGDSLQAGAYLSGQIEVEGQDETDTFGGSIKVGGDVTSFSPPANPVLTWQTTLSNYVTVPDLSNDLSVVPPGNPVLSFSALVWWKPVYMVKVQLGTIDDFALTEIVGWGYNANDADDFVVYPKNNYAGDYFSDTTGFYSGTGNGWIGLTLSVTPIYGLDINLAVPFGLGYEQFNNQTQVITKQSLASDIYLYSHAQIAYTLWGIGRLAVTVAGGGDGKIKFLNNPYDPFDFFDPTGTTDPINIDQIQGHGSSIYGSFLLTAFDEKGFGLNIGFGYTLPSEYKNIGITYYSPMEAGLGLSFGTDKMGIKTRMAVSFGGGLTRTGYGSLHEPLMVGLGVLPYYTLGSCTVYLNAGISYKWEDEFMMDSTYGYAVKKVGNSTALGWNVNPYVTVTFGSGTFFAGIQVWSDGLKYVGRTTKQSIRAQLFDPITHLSTGLDAYPGISIIEWAIPIGIQYSF